LETSCRITADRKPNLISPKAYPSISKYFLPHNTNFKYVERPLWYRVLLPIVTYLESTTSMEILLFTQVVYE